MANKIEQSISIKADVQGLDQLRKGKTDLDNLKKAAADIDAQGGVAGGKKGDVDPVSSMQKQINLVRKMHTMTNRMAKDMDKGAMIGSNSYVKNLDRNVKQFKKLADIQEDISDDAKGMTGPTGGGGIAGGKGGGAMGAAAGGMGMLKAGLGGMTQDNVIQSGVAGVGNIGQMMQSKGGKLGKVGKGVGIAAIAGGLAMTLGQLFGGKQEQRAEMGVGIERRLGTPMSKMQMLDIQKMSEYGVINQANLYRGIEAYTKSSGKGDYANQLAGMTRLQMKNVSPETAGAIAAMTSKAGGTLGTEAMVKLAEKGGYGRRVDEFASSVESLTGEMQGMGQMMNPENIARVISDLGAHGEVLRGASGMAAAKNINQSMIGAQSLQSPQQAMMYRALSKGGTLSHGAIMDRMSQGISGEGNLKDYLAYTKKIGGGSENTVRLLMKEGLSRPQAQALVSGDKEVSNKAISDITLADEGSSENVSGALDKIDETGTGQSIRSKLKRFGQKTLKKIIRPSKANDPFTTEEDYQKMKDKVAQDNADLERANRPFTQKEKGKISAEFTQTLLQQIANNTAQPPVILSPPAAANKK